MAHVLPQRHVNVRLDGKGLIAQFPPAHLVVNTMVIALGLISVPVRGDGHLQIALFPCAPRSVKTVASVSLLIHVNVTNSRTSLEISDREEVVLSFRRKMETPVLRSEG